MSLFRHLRGLAEAQPAGAKKGKREGFSMKGLRLNRMSPGAAQRLGMNQLKGGETGRRPTGLCKPQSFSAEPPFLPHESCHPSLEMTYEMSLMNMDLLWFHLFAKLARRAHSTTGHAKWGFKTCIRGVTFEVAKIDQEVHLEEDIGDHSFPGPMVGPLFWCVWFIRVRDHRDPSWEAFDF